MKEISVEKCTATLKKMADEDFKVNFVTLIRTKTPLFYVTTSEEKRFLKFVDYFCRARSYDCFVWDCFMSLRDSKDDKPAGGTKGAVKNPVQILDYIIDEAKSFVGNPDAVEALKKQNKKGYIYVLCDFFRFIREEDPNIERRLKTLASLDTEVSVVLTGPYYKATQTLENLIPTVDFPYPNKEEIKESLWFIVNSIMHKLPGIDTETKKMEEELSNAVRGLTLPEASLAFSKSLVVHKGWNIDTILEEKKQIIRKSGILEFYDNKTSLSDVGGLHNLVNWVIDRKQCFSEEAENYGLKKPRGLLTIGMPGCGKSLTCKAIAHSWKMPLLRLDFGKLFGSLVGESEAQARSALKLAESVAPCCLWVDEIEKALSGVSSSGKTDGGTTSRVLGTFLTWMQEHKESVFVVATANNHESIPPEFLRAGRFDEIFFVDLPTSSEREEVFSVLLRKRSYNPKDFNLKFLAVKTENFSGAEIEKAIDKAMLIGFSDGRRKITTEDIVKCVSGIKTLFAMRNEDFERLRDWADTQCLKANSDEAVNIKNVDDECNSVKNSIDELIESDDKGRNIEIE